MFEEGEWRGEPEIVAFLIYQIVFNIENGKERQ